MDLGLKGRVAFVAAASQGLGRAIAEELAREGARVLCVDHMKERAEETVGLIRGEGGTAEPFAADVTRFADCEAMVADAVARWGGLDILHNNVGIESRHTLLDTTEQEWDQVMAVDAKSMFLSTKAAVPAMETRGGGSVICVSSVAALRGHGRTETPNEIIPTAEERILKDVALACYQSQAEWPPTAPWFGDDQREFVL
jgi:NAD(P)-dependent dehydrogenase (short-subunit alcohol dehydrogenase family)